MLTGYEPAENPWEVNSSAVGSAGAKQLTTLHMRAWILFTLKETGSLSSETGSFQQGYFTLFNLFKFLQVNLG